MGKRKKSTRKAAGPKKQSPLPTIFACLFCNHDKSVSVKMDKKFALATLECNVCGQNWQTSINYLSEPVDVYAEWVDASEALKKDSNPPALALPAPRPARETGQQPPARIRSADDADLDDWGGDNA